MKSAEREGETRNIKEREMEAVKKERETKKRVGDGNRTNKESSVATSTAQIGRNAHPSLANAQQQPIRRLRRLTPVTRHVHMQPLLSACLSPLPRWLVSGSCPFSLSELTEHSTECTTEQQPPNCLARGSLGHYGAYHTSKVIVLLNAHCLSSHAAIRRSLPACLA